MKKIIGIVALILLVAVPAFGWGTCYKQLTSSSNNQEVLSVSSERYCFVKTVTIQNTDTDAVTVTVHFEGSAGQFNRLTPPVYLENKGDGYAIDFAEHIVGGKGLDIDADVSGTTPTVEIFIEYMVAHQPH